MTKQVTKQVTVFFEENNKILFIFVVNLFSMRNSDRKNKRDKLIVEAFYKRFDIDRMRIDDVLLELADDIFFLDPNYIYAVIFYNKGNKEYYDHLVEGTAQIPKRKLLKAI